MTQLRSHISNPKSSIFLLIKFMLLCEIVKQADTASILKNQEITTDVSRSAIPDFFVDSSGLIVAHPLITSIADKQIAFIDPRLQNQLTLSEQNNALTLCDEAIHDILKENSWIARGQFLHDINNSSLKIILTSPEISFDSSSIGSYSIKYQQIRIAHKPSLSKEDYKKALLNELMSYMVVMMHQRCGIVAKKDNYKALPFLNADGSINQSKRKALEKQINDGINQIGKLKILWEQRKEKLSADENNLLLRFFAAAKSYEPQTFHANLADLGGKNGLDKMIDTGFFHKDGEYIEPGPRFPKGTPYFRGKLQNNYIISHHTNNLRSARGRINAFLNDFHQIQTSLESKHGPYAQINKYQKLAELATFIGQFPKPLLELFFPEFLTKTTKDLSRCQTASALHGIDHPLFFKLPPHYPNRLRHVKIPEKPHASRDQPRKNNKHR